MIIQGEEALGLVCAICLLFQPGRAEAESFILHFNVRNAWIRVLGCCDVVTKPGVGAAVMKGGCLKHWVMTGAHLSALCVYSQWIWSRRKMSAEDTALLQDGWWGSMRM